MVDTLYVYRVPRLWSNTIESHRRQVREAIMDNAAELVFERGLRAVTMVQIAERAGIGRATLYKYFADVDAILHAWHARQIDEHMRQLNEIRDAEGDSRDRLRAVLTRYGHNRRQAGSHDAELMRVLHPVEQFADAQSRLRDVLGQLITEAVEAGQLRDDVDPTELAAYCLHALAGAASLSSDAAIDRLVAVVIDGLGGSWHLPAGRRP